MGTDVKEEEQALHLMFTYGTPKCGQFNHHILTNPDNGHATLLGAAKTLKKWPLVLVSSYEIPCLLPLEDVGHEVSGELYLIDDQMLRTIDSLEKHPDVYVRRQEDVVLQHAQANSTALDAEAKPQPETSPSTKAGDRRKAWIYFAREVESKHLSLPFVPFYEQRPEIMYPTFEGRKEEAECFLENEFKHFVVDNS